MQRKNRCGVMRIGPLVVLVLMAGGHLHAAQKKKRTPPTPIVYPQPTEAQMREAYKSAAKELVVRARYPPSIKLTPIDEARFRITGISPVTGGTIVNAYIVFDGQNGYGAMIRSTASCRVIIGSDTVLCSFIPNGLPLSDAYTLDSVEIPAGPNEAAVRLHSKPSDAAIEIDGRDEGTTPKGMALAAGEHKIRIIKPGFHPWAYTFVLEAGKPQNFEATLTPEKNEAK